MIVFPGRPPIRLAVTAAITAGILGILGIGAPAATAGNLAFQDPGWIRLAQTRSADQPGTPVRLIPRGDAQPPSDRPGESEPSTIAAERAEQPDTEGVTTSALSTLDTASVGLIDSAEGGLGISIWQGSQRALIEKLLARLPVRTRSAAARNLAIRLLSTRAESPRGDSGGPDLLTSRISRMLELGAVDAASRLANQISLDQTSESLARSAVEALFLENDNAGACQRVRDFARRSVDAYWQRAFAFCLLLSGNAARAEMIVDILAERGDDDTDLFAELIETLNGGEAAAVESLPDPTGLDLAMMRAANIRLPADVMSSDRPAVLRNVVASPNADLDLRLEAGERAFLYGAIDADNLNELYSAVQWQDADLADPVSTADRVWGPRGRALLLREAAAANSPAVKSLILSRAYGLARKKGGHEITGGASAPIVLSISPDTTLTWFAADAVSALLKAGHVERAQAWLQVGRGKAETDAGTDAGTDTQTRQTAARLWAIGLLAAPTVEKAAVNETALAAWRHTAYPDDAAAGRRATVLALSLLEALGVEASPGRWAELLAEGMPTRIPAPDIAWARALDEASTAGRVGETVLIALLGLAGVNADPPDATAMGMVVRSLRRVGLESEARTLALETAVAHGL